MIALTINLELNLNLMLITNAGFGSKPKKLLRYLDIVTLKRLLNSMYLWKTK